jgi:hypothetical protein
MCGKSLSCYVQKVVGISVTWLMCVGNLWPASVYTWVWCLRHISVSSRWTHLQPHSKFMQVFFLSISFLFNWFTQQTWCPPTTIAYLTPTPCLPKPYTYTPATRTMTACLVWMHFWPHSKFMQVFSLSISFLFDWFALQTWQPLPTSHPSHTYHITYPRCPTSQPLPTTLHALSLLYCTATIAYPTPTPHLRHSIYHYLHQQMEHLPYMLVEALNSMTIWR